ncbi:hypothetical protein QYE76_003884 [Lolium multiflorum]|uniref:Uncharacterized protein n=1 Tax=Lolium multiflorum TaxID=4521 RepID=A0AAD8W0W2_LOLMU|nr:hypothetical protein QYE76_003884 [Lolium multiflorum]
MAPRTKQCKNRAPGTDEPVKKVKVSSWERSKISAQDQKLLKKMGLVKKEALKMPGDESSPRPPIGFRDHQTLSSLPPLPEGGEVDGRVIVTDDSQESSLPESEAVESQRSAGLSGKDTESEQHPKSAHSISPPLSTSLDGRKRKRDNDEDSGASKLAEPAAKESSPEEQVAFDPFAETTLLAQLTKEQKRRNAQLKGQLLRAPPTRWFFPKNTVLPRKPRLPRSITQKRQLLCPAPERRRRRKLEQGMVAHKSLPLGPLMKELVNLGSQFIGFRDEAAALRDALRRAKECADALEAKLKASEKARKKAEKDVAAVESLRQRLKTAKDALSDKEAQQVERENAIVERFETQNRRFTRKMGEQYTSNQESDDRLNDDLETLELNCDLARTNISSTRAALKRVFPHFFPRDTQPEIFSQLTQHFLVKEDPALAYRHASLKIGVEGTIALVAASGQKVEGHKIGEVEGSGEGCQASLEEAHRLP